MNELPAVTGSLDELPRGAREWYRKEAEGDGTAERFVLSVRAVDGYALEHVEGLKSALGKERSRAEKAEKRAASFGDLDPESVRTQLARLEELGKLDPAREADKLAAEKVEAARHEMSAAHRRDMEKVGREKEQLAGQLRTVMIDAEASRAIAEARGSVQLLLPHIQRLARLAVRDDGTHAVEVTDADGNPRIADGSGRPMTISGLVEEMKQSDAFARAFDGSGTTGGGMRPDSAAGGAGVRELSAVEKIATGLNRRS